MQPTVKQEEPKQPWTYLPGDDVLPSMMSGQTAIMLASALFIAAMLITPAERKKMFEMLEKKEFLTLMAVSIRSAIFYFAGYLIGGCVTSVFVLYVEKSWFFMKNPPGMKETLTDQQIDILFYIFVKRVLAAALIWPFSIWGYGYQFFFLNFFRQIFHAFIRA